MGKYHCVVYNILCIVKAKNMILLEEVGSHCAYEGEPKSNWTLNLACKLEVVVRCAARCCGSTQCSSSRLYGVNLG